MQLYIVSLNYYVPNNSLQSYMYKSMESKYRTSRSVIAFLSMTKRQKIFSFCFYYGHYY